MTLFTDANVSPPPHGLQKSPEERTFYRSEYAGALIVPLTFVPKSTRRVVDRTKPVALIPVIDTDAGEKNPHDQLRELIRDEARQANVEATPQFVTRCVSTLLQDFRSGYEAYLKQKQGTGDLVFERKFQSGRRIVFARTQTLRMCGLLT